MPLARNQSRRQVIDRTTTKRELTHLPTWTGTNCLWLQQENRTVIAPKEMIVQISWGSESGKDCLYVHVVDPNEEQDYKVISLSFEDRGLFINTVGYVFDVLKDQLRGTFTGKANVEQPKKKKKLTRWVIMEDRGHLDSEYLFKTKKEAQQHLDFAGIKNCFPQKVKIKVPE